MSSVLPYFMCGPPLYKEAYNSSCGAIASILNNSQYGFPEVNLPTTDVRDVAAAHIAAINNRSLSKFNGRYMISTQSIWFSDIINLLKKNHKELGLPRIKTRVIGPLGINFAALVINR